MGDNPAPGNVKKPDHVVTAAPFEGRIMVTLGSECIADSANALLVRETSHGDVYYVPRADVRMDLATLTDASTYCPFKGTASYFSFTAGHKTAENAAWSYATPYDEATALKDHLAFYTSRVDAVSVE